MSHYKLNYKHSHRDIYNKPKTVNGSISMHGKRRECLEALEESFEEMIVEAAEDGTETFQFIEIVKVLETA